MACLQQISDGSLDDVEFPEFPKVPDQDGKGTISTGVIQPANFEEDSLSPSGPLANALLNEKDFELPSNSLEFHVSDGTPIKEKTLSQIEDVSHIDMNLLGEFSNDEEETLKRKVSKNLSQKSDSSQINEPLANSLLHDGTPNKEKTLTQIADESNVLSLIHI